VTSRPGSIRWVLAGRQARRFLLVAAFAVASVVLLLFLHPVILALQYGIEGWFFDRSFGRSNRGFLWSEASSALAGYVWSTWADIVRLDILPSSYSRPATRALGWHLASAIPCTLLSLLIMAPVIGRWNDPAPWRALRTTCVGLGVLYASLVAGVAMMAWDWKRLLWPARSGRRALSEGSLSPEEPLVLVLLLTPICIWFLRRLDETDDLLGRYQVAPVKLTPDFDRTARFDHSAHLTQRDARADDACLTCHAADTSTASTDVLMPDIQQCVTCHGDRAQRDLIPVDCVDCHSFHPTVATETVP